VQVTDDLPVQVIKGGRKKQQRTNDPAIITNHRGGLTGEIHATIKNIRENAGDSSAKIQLYKSLALV
jgi:hypothetical protein